MRHGILVVLVSMIWCGFSATAWSNTPVAEVSESLDELHRWLGSDANARHWRSFLRSDDLAAQLAKGNGADVAAVQDIRNKYSGTEYGLDLRRFTSVRMALDKWLAELQTPIADLPAAVRAAKDSFRPLAPDSVAQKRQELLTTLEEFDRWLQSGGSENANAWKAQVEWNALQKELAKADGPRPDELERIAALYRANKPGLETEDFIAVRRALHDYAHGIRLAGDAKLPESYATRLDDLATRLEALAGQPKLADIAAAGRTIGWLERAGQAPQVVTATRSRFHRPNVFALASRRFVEAAFDDPEAKAKMNQPQGHRDNILGTSLHGTVYPNLQMSVQLIPSDDRATINVQLNGSATSRNVGYNGPVTVWTNGYTQIATSKYVYFDADGATASGAAASCATSSNIQSIAAKCGLIERMAWKRAGKQQGQAEAIASAHAESRISGQIDSEMGSRLADANLRYKANFHDRLVRRDSFPQVFKVNSTEDAVHVQVVHAMPNQLTTATDPPELSGAHDLAIRLHETGVTNFGESLLGGETLTDERLLEMLQEAKAEVPEELQITEDKDPWSITFSTDQPVSAEFSGDQVKLGIRGRRFTRGDSEVRAEIEISAAYKLEKTGTGSKLTRQGEVSVEYVNRRQLSAVQVANKTFLRKKFDALFKPEITSDGLKLPDRLQGIGKLQLRQLSADQGWLTLGWTKQEQSEAPKVALAETEAVAAHP
jgi:hypothetical protein